MDQEKETIKLRVIRQFLMRDKAALGFFKDSAMFKNVVASCIYRILSGNSHYVESAHSVECIVIGTWIYPGGCQWISRCCIINLSCDGCHSSQVLGVLIASERNRMEGERFSVCSVRSCITNLLRTLSYPSRTDVRHKS